MARLPGLALLLLAVCMPAGAAPDEDVLGKAAGYPVAPNLARTNDDAYIVGSYSDMDRIAPHCTLAPSAQPLTLPVAAPETRFYYRYQGRMLTLDDYMQRQRATAVLVLKDGQIVAERYNYARTADMRMLSNSMAKTILALAIGKALEAGLIRSLDDTAATYVPALAGTLYGETRLVNLLRMASGARFVEDYSAADDRARFNADARRLGVLQAARAVHERAAPEGERFNYAGVQTQVLGLVLGQVLGTESICHYVATQLWQPLGAATEASWGLTPYEKIEYVQGAFNATVRDYARLGQMMANDGMGPTGAVLPRDYLLAMTDPTRQPEAFRPGRMQNKGSTYMGYGFQTWLYPVGAGSAPGRRRFALLGIHGQEVFVDPQLKLVVVHMAVGKDASGDASGNHLGAERDALLRGIVGTYGAW